MSARPVRIRIILANGDSAEVDACPTPTPGLVIHQAYAQSGESFSVTQQHSGIGVVTCLPSPEAALALAGELGALADWTRPVDIMRIFADARTLARRYGWEPEGRVRMGLEFYRAAGAIL